jgi:hypothetical protein
VELSGEVPEAPALGAQFDEFFSGLFCMHRLWWVGCDAWCVTCGA